MKISDWEAWYTYSVYLNDGIGDVDTLGKALVENGIGRVAMHRNGTFYWLDERGQLKSSRASIIPSYDNPQKATITAEVEEEEFGSENYRSQALRALWNMRFAESRLFANSDSNLWAQQDTEEGFLLTPSYMRLQLEPIVLASLDAETTELKEPVVLWPCVSIYEDGIILIRLRLLSNKDVETLSAEKFMSNVVNLPRRRFPIVSVPRAVAELIPVATQQLNSSLGIKERLEFRKTRTQHMKAVAEGVVDIEAMGGSQFSMFPSSLSENGDSLSTIALTLFNVISYLVSEPRDGLSHVVFRQKSMPAMGHFWWGRPSFTLIDFADQANNAQENEERHSTFFRSILNQTSAIGAKEGLLQLPKDQRVYNDFGLYVNSAATLCVWSKEFGQEYSRDNKFDCYPIYDRECQNEILNYGHILHRKIEEVSSSVGRYEEALLLQKRLIDLEKRMDMPTPFGEVAEFLSTGWSALKVKDIRKQIDASLSVNERLYQAREALSRDRFVILLTLVFGSLAIPGCAEGIVPPLWKIAGLPLPNTELETQVVFICVASISVFLLLILIVQFTKPKLDL